MNDVDIEVYDLFPCTREQVLENFDKYCNDLISLYAKKRNFDLGTPHDNVSKLSPYIRRRLVSENEVLQIALGKNSLSSLKNYSGDFLENHWRGYWKCGLTFMRII